MIDKIRQLEKTARLLEPDAAQRVQWLDAAAAHAEAFLEGLDTAPAYVPDSQGNPGLYDSPIAEDGIDIQQALSLLRENVDERGINAASGRYLGYVPGGGLFPAALGDYLAANSNRYAGLLFAAPGAVRMENMVLRWMADVVGYPALAGGNLSSGGSLANLTAVVAARDAHELNGERVSRAVIYVTQHTHYCVKKALHVAGLGQCIRRQVGVDAGYRMDPDALQDAISADRAAGLLPWLIVASAGSTNTGSVDPLARMGEIAAAEGLWFHVDGAYGGFFALCPEGQQVLKGMETSDSVVLDPHKTLFLPYGTGAVLVKDRNHLYRSFNVEADYIQKILVEEDELSPAEQSAELTKHFRGLRVWLPLKLLGVAPFRAALSEKIHLARYFHRRIQEIDGFQVGPAPDLSIVTYRYLPKHGDPDAFNQRLMDALQQEGRIFVSGTRIDGRLVLRAAIGCFRSHLDQIDETLEILSRTARRLESEA